ncbi:S9 family peptidase [Sphingomonas sp. LY29]|uniref:S9 family peptidase n=1 Tax=Sphingomonas sp. LY29 TaxID=3095341 RepID=UPI002D766FE1|nr:S9 family peptidase [Sphingomonas sp. LY29]WRP26658.1 S9 family peptidase [Sphingomonas sp. LY29]
MIKRTLLAAVLAASALASTPAIARPMTATDMHMMRRLGAPSVSPDGRYAIFTLSSTDLAANKRNNPLHLLDLRRPGAAPQPVAALKGGHSAVFGADGAIWYLAPAGGQDQLFRMTVGGRPVQVSSVKGDISGFKISANGSRLVLFADRDLRCTDFGCAGLPLKPATGSGRVYDQLFVRHWDTWVEPGVRSRIFSFTIANGRVTGPGVPVTGALVGDTPSKPFGGGEEIALSPDGRTVYFALREAGRIEPTSTNLDIFAAAADGSTPPVNLTDANDGTDTLPTLSPDGRTLAYVSMARVGYEADRLVVMLRDLATGQVRPLTSGWDRSVGSLAWTRDSRTLLVTAEDTMEAPVWRIDVGNGRVTRLTGNGHAGNVLPMPDGGALFTQNSVMAPDDLFRVTAGGTVSRLTDVNRDLLAQLDPVSFEKFAFRGADGDRVWGMKMKPAGARGKLPIAFVVHGGPQGSFGNGWSYRWNPRLFTSPGYAVVSIDFHGSTGYGQAFTDSIRNDWGGKPLEDLKRGLAYATAQDAQLDANNACALGASYGGYMMNWIAGKWSDRFKCLVQHDGVFDARAMAYETEELWFDEWEHGGKTYYEDPDAFEKWNPVNHVAQWKTPMLVITGEKDFRIPYTQGIASFTALQRRGIPSKLVVFPDENHWVLKPKNSIQWYGEVFGWMNRWMGPQPIMQNAAQ